LLDDAGLGGLVERHLSVEDAGRWKPDARAYAHAAQSCGVPIDAMALIAAHPWDVDGARRAGLASGWLNRSGAAYPEIFLPATVSGPDLVTVARALTGSPSLRTSEPAR
jgi:2-haloacid dehalogenase